MVFIWCAIGEKQRHTVAHWREILSRSTNLQRNLQFLSLLLLLYLAGIQSYKYSSTALFFYISSTFQKCVYRFPTMHRCWETASRSCTLTRNSASIAIFLKKLICSSSYYYSPQRHSLIRVQWYCAFSSTSSTLQKKGVRFYYDVPQNERPSDTHSVRFTVHKLLTGPTT